MEELIIKKAKDLFFSYGSKGVSMDDVAKHAGISKKTIYKAFEDKIQLVYTIVSELLNCHDGALKQCIDWAEDAIDEVALFTQIPFNTLAAVNPCFFYELEKFFPTVWQLIEDYKQHVLVPTIIKNLAKGIYEGVYRQGIDIYFVANVRVQQIIVALNQRSLIATMGQRHQLMLQLSEFYLHALATQNGKKLINKYLNVNNEKQFSN
jgi:AcrR family transcriptional regulator